jgi:HemK-related putative methylase
MHKYLIIEIYNEYFLIKITHERWNFEIYLKCPAKTFTPSPVSLLLVKNIMIDKDDIALDLGTGTGIFAIAAAKLGAERVCGIDIDPLEIMWARYNAKLNEVSEKIEFICGDMLNPFREKSFDFIVSNPPLTIVPPACQKITIDYGERPPETVQAGPNGRKYIDQIIKEAPKYLRSEKDNHGRLLLAHTSLSNIKKTISILKQNFEVKILEEIETPFTSRQMLIMDWIQKLKEKGEAEFIFRNNIPYRKIIVIQAISCM